MKKIAFFVLSLLCLTSCTSKNYAVTQILYDENDKELSKIVETYNEKDQLLQTKTETEEINYEYKNDLLVQVDNGRTISEYIYNDQNQLIKNVMKKNDVIVEEATVTYNEFGEYDTLVVNKDNEILESHYTYDNQNRLIAIENSESSQYFEYDDNGNEIQWTVYEDQKEVLKTESEYENDRLKYKTTIKDNQKTFEEYTYDDKQRVSEIKYFDADKKYTGKTMFSYE